ncbi:CaiB/BaiF CoA-transferase family protein [Aurantimonas sp. VKM B-3413]|uniref:CaiB/BaiF CoA transferase family protein n=1 Tax=Aurantimonas sp. VKM B-3413 TaxID=2779401 RepID=UPI001E571B70|nr:CoA transferase [Aurantimonas sp. VKM B-3413]MCB8838054.1 CoA transferase [Aurantimonas sp. VKM B-3413]
MQALQNLKVLDLSRYIAGPNCGMILGDMGADVVKVETPGRGEETRLLDPKIGEHGIYTLVFNRNKRAMTLNFRSQAGQELLRKLIREADVLIENFRPGTLEKMGCDWETLHAMNERLIMVRISGYGQTGPWTKKPCFDAIAQAGGGIMQLTGEEGGEPLPAGTFIVDYVTSLYASIGVLSAVEARHSTGEGQLVDLAMLDCTTSLLMTAIPEYALTGKELTRCGARDRYSSPASNFECGDGRWVHINAGSDALFPRFAKATGHASLLEDDRFASNAERLKRVPEVEAIVSGWTSTRASEEVIEIMAEAGVPCARIDRIGEIFANEQLRSRGQIMEVESAAYGKLTMAGIPIQLSETPGKLRHAPPVVGEHTDEVLKDWLKLDNAGVAALRESKAV